ncbi:MAG: hypothetical protein OXC96_09040, partial [Cyanobacteria bacterium MAG CAR1_bin_15]|nr:hypothetical protein [Cyanobacteria bacterium MAG CAR1_bin_15]
HKPGQEGLPCPPLIQNWGYSGSLQFWIRISPGLERSGEEAATSWFAYSELGYSTIGELYIQLMDQVIFRVSYCSRMRLDVSPRIRPI